MASHTGIYWNILEILEKAFDTGKYTGKGPFFRNILEKIYWNMVSQNLILEYTGNWMVYPP